MQTYQISDLERLTGIKAHTIRIWEKRYSMITPHRTITNRRFYDNNQVRKLLNVATLLSHGHKISKVAALNEQEINIYLLGQVKFNSRDREMNGYINDLIKAMLSFDEQLFEKIFSIATEKYGLHDTMMKVIYPYLEKTGVQWSAYKAIPVQEHFASMIIRKKLLVATETLPAPHIKNNDFLLFLPPGEWHETGLLFANYLIRAAGCKTVYLGQNVPFENIHEITHILSPRYMLLFFIATRPPREIEAQLTTLSENNKGISILVAGSHAVIKPVQTISTNITYLSGADSLLPYLK